MKIVQVNNQPTSVSDQASISVLLEQLALDVRGLAVAIDNQVIPQKDWQEFKLEEGHRITIIRATQGG